MESKTQDDIIRSEKVEEREKEGSEQADTNRAEYGCLSKKEPFMAILTFGSHVR